MAAANTTSVMSWIGLPMGLPTNQWCSTRSTTQARLKTSRTTCPSARNHGLAVNARKSAVSSSTANVSPAGWSVAKTAFARDAPTQPRTSGGLSELGYRPNSVYQTASKIWISRCRRKSATVRRANARRSTVSAFHLGWVVIRSAIVKTVWIWNRSRTGDPSRTSPGSRSSEQRRLYIHIYISLILSLPTFKFLT